MFTGLNAINNLLGLWARERSNEGGGNTGGHFVYWVGQDGNIWVNRDGNTWNAGRAIHTFDNGFDSDTVSMAGGTRIDDPNPGGGGGGAAPTGGGGGGYSYYDAAAAAQRAKEAARAAEADRIKSGMLGRRGELDEILNAVLSNIDATYREESNKRKGQYDTDAAELLSTLNRALPEIASSFASIGSYDSSWNNDSQAHTTDEYNKSQATLTNEFNTDMANLGNKANQARTDARTSYNNNQIDFDTLAGTEANSDNLEAIRNSENSLSKAINQFSQSREYYKPGSTFANELSNLAGVYNYAAIKNAFDNYLSTAGAGATNVTQNLEPTARSQAEGRNRDKTELQENTPTSIK